MSSSKRTRTTDIASLASRASMDAEAPVALQLRVDTLASVPADGRSSFCLEVSAYYPPSDAAVGVPIFLDVGKAQKITIWWDEALTKPVAFNTVIVGGLNQATQKTQLMQRVYLSCYAHAAENCTLVATPLSPATNDPWPGSQTASETYVFTDPAASSGPSSLTVYNVTENLVITLSEPARTTPIIVQIFNTDNYTPWANKEVTGKVVWMNAQNTSAGTVQTNSPDTDGKGYITLSIYANGEGKALLIITDVATQAQGTLSNLATRLLDSVDISAQPNPIASPGVVTLTAAIKEKGQSNPDGLQLLWTYGDQESEKYFPDESITITNHSQPSSFQYTTAPISQYDLDHSTPGHLASQLQVHSSLSTFFSLFFHDPFQPMQQGLPPPWSDFGGSVITDDIVEASKLSGITFGVKAPTDPPTDDTGSLVLWGHVKPGELQPHIGRDIMLQQISIPHTKAGQDLKVSVCTQNTVFSRNWNVDVYYVVDFGNIAISQVFPVTVERLSLMKGPQPTTNLEAPQPTQGYSYTWSNWLAHSMLGVRVAFGGAYHAKPGDVLTVSLQALGAATNNMNRQLLLYLQPYTITQTDYNDANPYVTITFDGSAGNPAGFPFTDFTGLDLYLGEIYIDVVPYASQIPMRSFGTPISICTLSPYTGNMQRLLDQLNEPTRISIRP